jgi:hypothetical protein
MQDFSEQTNQQKSVNLICYPTDNDFHSVDSVILVHDQTILAAKPFDDE